MRISDIVIVTLASQLSVAVTVGAAGMVEHSTVIFDGTPTNTGMVVSWTVICWLVVAVLPQLSVAVHVRVKR